MRILLDESLPRRLRSELPGPRSPNEAAPCEVTREPRQRRCPGTKCRSPVHQGIRCGWSGLENGELLRVAANEFDVFLTADQNLEYQQNLRELSLTVIALVARNNTFETLQSLMPEVLHRLADIEPYTLSRVGD